MMGYLTPPLASYTQRKKEGVTCSGGLLAVSQFVGAVWCSYITLGPLGTLKIRLSPRLKNPEKKNKQVNKQNKPPSLPPPPT